MYIKATVPSELVQLPVQKLDNVVYDTELLIVRYHEITTFCTIIDNTVGDFDEP